MPEFAYLGEDHGRGLLESALSVPQQSFGGYYLHRTIFDKAAALFRSLVKNHPLVDGNKRLALTCVTVFLMINGYIFHVPKDDAVQFTLGIAAEEGNVELKDICSWFRRYSIKTTRLREISQIVTGFVPFSQKAMDSLIRNDTR